MLQVMLSGINQMVLGDKRTMKFAYCGSASSLHFAVTAPPRLRGGFGYLWYPNCSKSNLRGFGPSQLLHNVP
jgi:hypothetical protein